MKHHLYIFGDSWAYGAELDPGTRRQQNYAGQLGVMLGVDQVRNYSEVASSISHMHLQVRQAMIESVGDDSKKTAIFFLTGQQRFLFFDMDGEFVNLNPSGEYFHRPMQQKYESLFKEINKFYYKKIQSKQADDISLNTNLLAFQTLCKHHNIDDYYISGWQTLNLWPEVDATKIYRQGQSHCAELLGLLSKKGTIRFEIPEKNQYIYPHGSHPNAQGHRLIAQTLYDFIKSKNIDTKI